MKMKTLVHLSLLAVFWSTEIKARGNAQLVLRAFVPPSINTHVSQIQLSSSQSLITFSGHINSRYLLESQKFEVEGLDQPGLEAQIKMISGQERTIQYEVLINHLKASMPAHRPIFLKISAN